MSDGTEQRAHPCLGVRTSLAKKLVPLLMKPRGLRLGLANWDSSCGSLRNTSAILSLTTRSQKRNEKSPADSTPTSAKNFTCGSPFSIAFSSGKGAEVVTSAVIGSSPVLHSEVSWIIVSLRERFEAVRRNEVHRVRGRLGNLSSDQEDVVGIAESWHCRKGAPGTGGSVVGRWYRQPGCLYRRDRAQDFQSAKIKPSL
jgi:hypothetical protein